MLSICIYQVHTWYTAVASIPFYTLRMMIEDACYSYFNTKLLYVSVVHATERKYFRHSTLVHRVQSTRSLLLLRKHHTGLSTRVPSGKRGIQLTVLCTSSLSFINPQRHPRDIGGGEKGRASGGGRSPAGRYRSGGREEPTGGSAPTAAEIRVALEENPAMLQELGLAWVRNESEIAHAFQVPSHVMAQSARLAADLEKALAATEAEAAVHAATIKEAAASVRSLGKCAVGRGSPNVPGGTLCAGGNRGALRGRFLGKTGGQPWCSSPHVPGRGGADEESTARSSPGRGCRPRL